MDLYTLPGKLLILISLIGVASALQCIVCDWNSHNGSVEAACLEAPFKTETAECAKSNSPGERIICETRAKFNAASRSLERLERKCGSKHAKCNNACAEDVMDCWLCCSENDKCNGFPLRDNIVVTVTSGVGVIFISKCVVLATVWLSLFLM